VSSLYIRRNFKSTTLATRPGASVLARAGIGQGDKS
jgi:hypothetical protein